MSSSTDSEKPSINSTGEVDSVELMVRVLKKTNQLEQDVGATVIKDRPEEPILAFAKLGFLDEGKALPEVAKKLGLDFCDLQDSTAELHFDIKPFVSKLQTKFLWKQKVIPLYAKGGSIVVAMANPLKLDAIQSLEFQLDSPVTPVLAEELKIVALLKEHFPQSNSSFDKLKTVSSGAVEVMDLYTESPDSGSDRSDAPPVVRLGNKILCDAVERGASDIHIEPIEGGVDIRFRVDGVMQHIFEIPRRLQPYIVSRFKLLSGMDIAEKRRPQDGRLRVRINKKPLDLRVSAVPTAFGEKLVLRLLDPDVSKLAFGRLGFPAQVSKCLSDALNKRGKVILVTGPTGSGKTSTLYSSLNLLSDGTTNIQTVEDPIEFRIAGVSQIQVNEATNLTFASALRSILRQDPDVIMIGEIRDSETADIAMQAAQTGHLVVSTLHTNDAISSITRLMNLECEPYLIATSVSLVVAQRLVRKVCANCRVAADPAYLEPHRGIIEQYEIATQNVEYGAGCDECFHTGYKGRTGLFSCLEVTSEIATLISDGADNYEIEKVAKGQGYMPLTDAAISLLESGATTFEEIKPYLEKRSDDADAPSQKIEVPLAIPVTGDETVSESKSDCVEKATILLVEDDENIRAIMALVLEGAMFNVVEAVDGQDGLQKFFEQKPSLVLLDYMMPKMNGMEFLRSVKSNPAAKDVPVIMLTAASTESNETEFLWAGATDFIGKGVSPKVLLARITRALGDRS